MTISVDRQQSSPPHDAATDRVLIIGAGPTGCTMALLLARYGVDVTLVERRTEPQRHPAASILNTRTMEIYRELGIADEILDSCQDVFARGNIAWRTSLSGRRLGKLSAFQEDLDQQLALSPSHTVHFPQHRLEPMLWRRVQAEPAIDFQTGQRCEEFFQSQSQSQSQSAGHQGITASLSPVASDGVPAAPQPFAYIIGCDGSESALRKLARIPFPGRVLQNMIGVHFEADLKAHVHDCPSILYWLLNQHTLGVLIAHWLPTEWVLFFPYYPPQETAAEFDQAAVREKIFAALGTRDVPDLKIHTTHPWKMTARLADHFRQGRLFLAGDAAHTFPPTGGLGLNTGVQDAHNLAWKLAGVLHGQLPEMILDSYERERRTIAAENSQHSIDNYFKMSALTEVAGLRLTDLDRLRALQDHALFRRLLPLRIQRKLLQTAVKIALRRLDRLDVANPRGDQLRHEFASRIPDQVPHYRSLGLDLGFCYQPSPPARHSQIKSDAVTRYESALVLGGRLPHVWLEQQQAPGAPKSKLSSHDLIALQGLTLITTAEFVDLWHQVIAAGYLPPEFGFAGRLQAVFPAEEAKDVRGAGHEVESRAMILDVEGKWHALTSGYGCVAVFVRPDGHIAWLPHRDEIPTAPVTQQHPELTSYLSPEKSHA